MLRRVPIDVARVIGIELPEIASDWDEDDVILYHLAVGAGASTTADGELAYVYERGLKVLPSFGVLPAMGSLPAMLDLPGMDVDFAHLLHGEQAIELHEPLPTSCSVRTTSRIVDVFDKGAAALVILETTTRDARDGRPLATNRFGAFIRGAGGFGGDSGPPPGNVPPQRRPDTETTYVTLPQQALLYRLTGDKNPLHADPAVAAKAGFDRPILHGLCTFGIVCKAIVDGRLSGDVSRIAGYSARFAGAVFPGETIAVSSWDQGERIVVSARCVERDTTVLSHAAVHLR
jgi:acyl dehydratase